MPHLHRPREPDQLCPGIVRQRDLTPRCQYQTWSLLGDQRGGVVARHFSPTSTAQDVIEEREKALEEARQLYVIEESQFITLVSDRGSQFTPISSWSWARWLPLY